MTLGRAFLLWIVGVLVFTLILVSALVLTTLQKTLSEELMHHSEVVARSIAMAVAQGESPAHLPAASMQDVRSAVVRTEDGQLLWAYGPDPSEVRALDSSLILITESVAASRPELIGSQMVRVEMLVSPLRMRRHLADSGLRLLGGLFAALAVAMVIGLIFVSRVVGPLNELAAQVRAFHPERPLQVVVGRATSAEVAALALAFSEMTQRLAVQRKELLASEQRFKELFESSPTPLVELDEALRMVGANPASAPFLGDVVADGSLDGFLEGAETEDLEAAAAAARAGSEGVVEGRWRLASGDLAEVELHLRQVAGERDAAYLMAVHDLTDRVRRLGERWRQTFEAMDDGVALVDREGQVELANHAIAPHLEALRPHLLRWAEAEGETSWSMSSGERTLQCTMTVPDDLGSCILVVRDVTDAMRAEAHLREAQKMEAVATLASGVAHDFNNLLAGIQLHLRLLQRRPEAAVEAAAAIGDLADQGEEVVRELLLFARRESTPHQVLDLAAVVRQQSTVLHHLLPAEVELRLRLAEEPVPVEGSAVALRRVVLNLVLNARDAVSSGWVEIRVRRDEQRAVLEVADNGSGVAEAHRSRLFEPFFSSRREGRGAGLGLAVVYAIVSEHGGEITVDSEPGKGSRFGVLLPLASAEDLEPAAPLAGATDGFAGARLLLLEPDGKLAVRWVEELAAAGFEVRHVQSTDRVRRLVEDWMPDVVIVGSAGVDGAELTRELGLPAVVLGAGPEESVTVAGTAPRLVQLQRPVTAERLVAAVRRTLDRRRPGP